VLRSGLVTETRSRVSFASTVLPNPSASFGCTTRRSQIAIEPAAP
jgi:hypothetical protein